MAMDDQQKLITTYFMQLPQPENKVQCMHVWIDGTLRNFRTKDITLPQKPSSADKLNPMEFCGSATDFDVGNLADYYSKPIKFYKDPFRGGNNTIVYCETYSRDGLPTFANNRYRLNVAREKYTSQVKNFTFYQSFTLLKQDGHLLTYLNPAYSPDSKSGFVCGREVIESHYRACLYAGVNISSYEPISNQGQWSYSIGPGDSLDVADDSWMSRFLLMRTAEDFGVSICFENTLSYSCLVPINAELCLATSSISDGERERIMNNLLSQMVIKEGKPVKVISWCKNTRVSNINPETDPYALLTKVIEVICENNVIR